MPALGTFVLLTAFVTCAIMLFMFAMTWVAALVYTQ